MKHDRTPQEVFQQQIYACCWFERKSLVQTIRSIGSDNVMFETDFPHPTCLYPGAADYVRDAAAEMTAEERRKIFGGTAENRNPSSGSRSSRVRCSPIGISEPSSRV